jgi:hypothetical protein
MNQKSITWWVIGIVAVVIVGAGWWYFSQPASSNLSSDKSITSFNFESLNPAVNGIVDNSAYTVTATVPAGTDLTTLTPTIALSSDLAMVNPSSGTVQDFTSPVTYTITAEDGSTQSYTITVTKAAQ